MVKPTQKQFEFMVPEEISGEYDTKAISAVLYDSDDLPRYTYWKPLTDSRVDELISERVAMQQELATLKAQRAAAIEQLEAKLNRWDWAHSAPLETYMLARLEATGQSTVILPHGTLKVTALSAAPRVEDQEALIDFLESTTDHGELVEQIKTVKSIPSSVVTKYCKQTGECLPGVAMTEARKSATISVPSLTPGGKSVSIKVDPKAVVRVAYEQKEEEAEG